jgi:hypothetical protein
VQALLIVFILLALVTAVLAAVFNYAGRPGPDPKEEGFFQLGRYGKVTTWLNIATAVFVAVSGFLAVTA